MLNSDKDILDIPMKTILIENMRIANIISFLKKFFENWVKFILKLKLIIDVTNIHRSAYINEILTIKSMTFKRCYSITQYI